MTGLRKDHKRFDWPLQAVVLYITQNAPILMGHLRMQLKVAKYSQKTIGVQILRVRRCPLFLVVNETIRLRYPDRRS